MPKDNLVKLISNNSNDICFLGLDCSSSTVGWGFTKLSNNIPQLLSYGHIKPLSNKFNEIIRLDDVYKKITNLCINLKPTFVSIEDIFLFMKGHSSAKTITILTSFNRIISLAAYHNSKDIFFYSVHEIRKIISKYYNLDKISKEDIPDIIIKYLSKNFIKKLNKNNKIKKEVFDEADGIAASLAALLQYYNNILPLTKKTRKKRKR